MSLNESLDRVLTRYKELESENGELKKMLADEMLKNRVLEETLKKKW